MKVILISNWDELSTYATAWQDLAADALEPNPFYEDWMLIPALRYLGAGKRVHCLLFLQTDSRSPQRASLLCGVLPIERQHRYSALPVSGWSVWKHPHCFLTTPLFRKNHGAECLAALFKWFHSGEGACHFFEWHCLSGEGPFYQLLATQLNDCKTVPLVSELYCRAFLQRMDTVEDYLSAALSSKHRKALRRRAELLSEMGRVEYVVLQPDIDIQPWIDSFLKIEAEGWKGQEGTALACKESHRSFFVDIVTQAFERNRLLMAALLLDGAPIAQNCYFRSGRGSFHFKPAFDEQYARFSPGFHMECETIRYLHAQPDIEWMDSCTSANNEMYNRLFLSRRTIQSLVIPVGGAAGRALVSTLPLLRSLKHSLAALRPAPGEAKPPTTVKSLPLEDPAKDLPVAALR
jgi:hypothetical protein